MQGRLPGATLGTAPRSPSSQLGLRADVDQPTHVAGVHRPDAAGRRPPTAAIASACSPPLSFLLGSSRCPQLLAHGCGLARASRERRCMRKVLPHLSNFPGVVTLKAGFMEGFLCRGEMQGNRPRLFLASQAGTHAPSPASRQCVAGSRLALLAPPPALAAQAARTRSSALLPTGPAGHASQHVLAAGFGPRLSTPRLPHVCLPAQPGRACRRSCRGAGSGQRSAAAAACHRRRRCRGA